MTLIDDLAHDVALGNVRGFMRQHARQFVLVARRKNQAALNGYKAPGYRERIDNRIAQDEVVELMLALFSLTRQAVSDFLSVLADLGVGENQAGVANLVNVGEARVILVFNRDRGIRRAAQIWEILIGPLDALSVAHTNAAGNRRRG